MNNTRAEKLKLLIETSFNGSQTKLAAKCNMSLAQLGQYLSGYRNLGEKVARRIELKAKLPVGWLDRPINLNESLSNQITIHEAIDTLCSHLANLEIDDRRRVGEMLAHMAVGLRDSEKAVVIDNIINPKPKVEVFFRQAS